MASVSECNEARKVQSPAKRNRGTVDCLFLLLSMFVLSSIARCDSVSCLILEIKFYVVRVISSTTTASNERS